MLLILLYGRQCIGSPHIEFEINIRYVQEKLLTLLFVTFTPNNDLLISTIIM